MPKNKTWAEQKVYLDRNPTVKEKILARRRKRYQDNIAVERKTARERQERLRREAGVQPRKAAAPKGPGMSASEKGRKGAAARWSKHTPSASPRNPVPSDVRSLWNMAHPNSMIRRKFPTMASLRRHYELGHYS